MRYLAKGAEMNMYRFGLVSFSFGLTRAVKLEMGRKSYRRILKRAKGLYKKMDKRIPNQKGIMGFHRAFWMLGLSLYRAMEYEPGTKEQRIEHIHNILWACRWSELVRLQAFFVRRNKQPFERFLKLLGPRNEGFFPCPPWEKVEVELENGIGWHQLQCPVYEFFKNEGVVELTGAYCDLDRKITALASDHVELKRERTLALGDDWCDFYYYRGDQPASIAGPGRELR